MLTARNNVLISSMFRSGMSWSISILIFFTMSSSLAPWRKRDTCDKSNFKFLKFQGKYCPFCVQIYREKDPDSFDGKEVRISYFRLCRALSVSIVFKWIRCLDVG